MAEKNKNDAEALEKEPLSREDMKRVCEAVLFAAGYPVTFKKLGAVLGTTEDEVLSLIEEYKEEYDKKLERGVQLLILGDKCQLVTKEEYAPYIREALGVREGGNLSKSTLETLAIIAYNQPVTRTYIDQVRGVDSSYAVGNLLERGLIECRGRMDVPGKPRLYGTTAAFLCSFGLSSISELPPLELSAGENL